jgi:hypothetical protein
MIKGGHKSGPRVQFAMEILASKFKQTSNSIFNMPRHSITYTAVFMLVVVYLINGLSDSIL